MSNFVGCARCAGWIRFELTERIAINMQSVLLITGWGVGVEPLQHLQQQLRGAGCVAEVINIFDAADPIAFQASLAKVQHYDVLVGWSLGGQLATLLAQQFWEQTGIAKTLITLASNPCFVQREAWSWAMPDVDFQAFKQSFYAQPQSCIKRFCYLLTQGDVQAKNNWLSLQSLIVPQDDRLMKKGLELLETLNLVSMLKQYQGKQLHLFASQDALVDHRIAQYCQQLTAKFLNVDYVEGSHSFPFFQDAETSDKILKFISEND